MTVNIWFSGLVMVLLEVCSLSVLSVPLLAQSQTLSVSAVMDLWQAGGNNDGSTGGIPPAVYAFSAAAGQTITFSSITGSWGCVPTYSFGPDGTTNNCFGISGGEDNIVIPPTGNLSGYASTDFVGALVGVFLADNLPPSAPPSLRFYETDGSLGGIQTNFLTLSPLIGQIFFIGDGLTGTGTGSVQAFQVPTTATHLYLGFVDVCSTMAPGCYFDNQGSVTAVFSITPVAASPYGISLGNVELCRTKKAVVTLTNNGSTKVHFGPISFVDVTGNPGDFSDIEYCHNGNLDAGHSCTVAVKFSPSEEASESATLNIVTSAPGSPIQMPITGTGIANSNGCTD